jgi:transcriptional regulator with XRE-family HTH domain
MGIKSVFGANLKYYRKKMNLSQEELSEQVGITPKHLSTIETGATFVSADLLERLTKRLGVSASALFYTVKEKSTDDSTLAVIDQIVDQEFQKTAETIKLQIRLGCLK